MATPEGAPVAISPSLVAAARPLQNNRRPAQLAPSMQIADGRQTKAHISGVSG